MFKGVAAKSAKNSSVKKLMLLAMVLDIPEKYETVTKVLNLVNLEGVEYMTEADLKLLLILVGKPGGKPKFGCPFCSACTPYEKNGELYCLNDLLELHQQYKDSGADPKTQQHYQNVVNAPLIVAQGEDLILGVLAVPELHILLGVVDKLMSGIENEVFSSKEMGREFMDKFLKKVMN